MNNERQNCGCWLSEMIAPCRIAGLVDSIRRMLARLTATQFIRNMTSGKTAPLLCGCADQTGRNNGEFVVKFLSAKGALFELLGSRLANHFGILVPEPAAVQVEQEFADVVNERLCQQTPPRKVGAGLNFGSRVVNPMTTWLVNRVIPEAMFRDAVNIFAFDALVQNPDRRVANPNLFTQGDSIYVYDHEETSFSFLLALSPSTEPWNLEGEMYLEDHVFYSRLRAKEIDLKDFGQSLKALTGEVLTGIREEVPQEWAHEDLERIEGHLMKVQKNADKFVEQVRRRLA